MDKPAVFYITEGYPFKAAEVFPGDELPFLAAEDWDVFLLPGAMPAPTPVPTPSGVRVRTDLVSTREQRRAHLLSCEAARLAWSEYWSQRTHGITPRPRYMLGELGVALHTRAALRALMLEHGLHRRPLVIYNFWCIPTAFGASLLRREFPHVRVVARALGGDIYPEQNEGSYIPFRFLRRTRFDTIIPCAEMGRDFLLNEGVPAERLTVARLGVPDAPGIAPPSPAGHLAFVSCSSFVPVKRLPLLIDSLRALALARPELTFSWDHVGSRENRPALEAIAREQLEDLPNLTYSLHGGMTLAEVRAFFASKPLDVLVNVSFSEGLPVSMMEATAAGLPVLGTDVGGVREIVTPETGILLPVDFTKEQFADAALRMQAWKDAAARQSVVRFSREHFSAARNYQAFIQRVLLPAVEASRAELAKG